MLKGFMLSNFLAIGDELLQVLKFYQFLHEVLEQSVILNGVSNILMIVTILLWVTLIYCDTYGICKGFLKFVIIKDLKDLCRRCS